MLNNPRGKTTIYRKNQDRLESEPFYRELKEELVRESDHTVTLKKEKLIRKSDLAIKRQPAPKKASPRKRDQLVKFIIDLENQTERPLQDQADLKVEIPNRTESKIEKPEIPLIDLDSDDNS